MPPKVYGVQSETRVAGFFVQRSPPPITFFDDRDVASVSALEAFQSDSQACEVSTASRPGWAWEKK
jgi:hypothetical protein